MAAGLSIHPDRLDAFRERINAIARRSLKPEDLQPALRLDAEVRLGELTVQRLDELQRLQQTGVGNPAVQLCVRNVGHGRALQRMGAKKQHAKLWISDGDRTCEAVLWNAGDGSLPVGKFDVAFAPQLNNYAGRTTVQLKVLDWRPTE